MIDRYSVRTLDGKLVLLIPRYALYDDRTLVRNEEPEDLCFCGDCDRPLTAPYLRRSVEHDELHIRHFDEAYPAVWKARK
jgi:hypothetical protein